MNNNNPNAADAPVPPEGTEQALAEALDQAGKKPKPQDSSTAESVGDSHALDLASDAIDVVIAIFE